MRAALLAPQAESLLGFRIDGKPELLREIELLHRCGCREIHLFLPQEPSPTAIPDSPFLSKHRLPAEEWAAAICSLLQEKETGGILLMQAGCIVQEEELLLFLSMTGPSEDAVFGSFHSEQAEIVRRIHDALTSDLRKRYTIEELSRQYLINTAALKSVFKSVYGMPVASYMKQYRIRKAAELLRSTDKSVSEIASEVGYESQSKFSAAFKDIMKILPTDYRRQYT